MTITQRLTNTLLHKDNNEPMSKHLIHSLEHLTRYHTKTKFCVQHQDLFTYQRTRVRSGLSLADPPRLLRVIESRLGDAVTGSERSTLPTLPALSSRASSGRVSGGKSRCLVEAYVSALQIQPNPSKEEDCIQPPGPVKPGKPFPRPGFE